MTERKTGYMLRSSEEHDLPQVDGAPALGRHPGVEDPGVYGFDAQFQPRDAVDRRDDEDDAIALFLHLDLGRPHLVYLQIVDEGSIERDARGLRARRLDRERVADALTREAFIGDVERWSARR